MGDKVLRPIEHLSKTVPPGQLRVCEAELRTGRRCPWGIVGDSDGARIVSCSDLGRPGHNDAGQHQGGDCHHHHDLHEASALRSEGSSGGIIFWFEESHRCFLFSHAGYSVTVARMVQLGPLGAAGIGVASMVGAGVFYVWAPATERAGSWVLLALVLAGVIAVLNAITMAQLAVAQPVSGGGYAYARRYLSPGFGFVSGCVFLAGKTASVAAVALIAANHILPENAPVVAAVLVGVFAAVNISGVRSTAGVSLVIAVIVVGVLVASVGSTGSGAYGVGWGGEGTPHGVLGAAALLFFAFAGYARMATLGAEIRSPRRVLPWVIVGTILGVVGLYGVVGWFVVSQLGVEAVGASLTPVADAVPESWRGVVTAVAALAAMGSLMTILAGLSRTALAMAEGNDAPPLVGFVWHRTGTPVVAEVVVAVVASVVVFVGDPLWFVGVSSGAVLTYYAIAHLSALRQPASERFVPRVVQVIGLAGCVALIAALPLHTVVTSAVLVAISVALWWLVVTPRRKLG